MPLDVRIAAEQYCTERATSELPQAAVTRAAGYLGHDSHDVLELGHPLTQLFHHRRQRDPLADGSGGAGKRETGMGKADLFLAGVV